MNNDLTQNKCWDVVLFICRYFCSMSPEIQACLNGEIPATNVKEPRLKATGKTCC